MTMLRVLAERAQCLVASPALLQANEAGPGLRRIICARRQPAQAQLPDPASVNSPVFASLIPVILCIGAGFLAARLGWVRAAAIKDLSNLVFLVLTPALLFRTMGAVRMQELDFQPVALYRSEERRVGKECRSR